MCLYTEISYIDRLVYETKQRKGYEVCITTVKGRSKTQSKTQRLSGLHIRQTGGWEHSEGI